jgi:hypothetical protein
MKVLAGCMMALTLAATAQADVPVFHDDELHLDAVATLSPDGDHYYRDVVLQREKDGRFRVASATSRVLVAVRTAQAQVFSSVGKGASLQASVHVTGMTSKDCVTLEEPAFTRVATTFHVVLAETAIEPGTACVAQGKGQSFELTVPLEVAALPAGTYVVDVNGVADSFTLGNAVP